MRHLSLRLSLSLFSLVLVLFVGATTHAHGDEKPLWALNKAQRIELQQTIERHRQELLKALDEAAKYGVDTESLQRPYQLDSNKEVANVPRSVLNRVIMASLNLEVESTRMYVFCETGCEHSLFKDLAGHPKRAEAVGVIRTLWPKLKTSFTMLFRDIPAGIWMRMIHASSYTRSIMMNARYQSKAYGRISMLAGAAGFGVAFGVTEVAESMFMGPLHIVCQANYFWSIAFGTAIASLSRDIKTLLLFEKDGKSIFRRIGQTFSNFASLRNAQQIEKRILFQTLTGSGDTETFEKLTKRDAQSSVLEPLLEKISAKQAVAADQMLWSELAWALKDKSKVSADVPAARTRLFDTEMQKIFDASAKNGEPSHRWQDLNASLRVILKMFRNEVEVRHMITRRQKPQIKTLGQLDAQLRRLDLFMFSKLEGSSLSSPAQNAQSAEWLRNIVSEWLSLAVETSSGTADMKNIELRLAHLKAILDASIRKGNNIGVAPEGFRDLMTAVAKERPGATAPVIRSCEALFTAVR